MTTTDTRAALDAAIDDYGNATAREAMNADERAALDRAITAHVEAEVARRLAVADSVDEGPDGLAEVEAEQVASIERLRAAIAADRERAVEAAEHAAFILGRNAVLAHPDGCGLIARPTPDEARRLVDALSDAAYDAGVAVERRAGDGWRESVEKKRDDTRTALLRALGVEA